MHKITITLTYYDDHDNTAMSEMDAQIMVDDVFETLCLGGYALSPSLTYEVERIVEPLPDHLRDDDEDYLYEGMLRPFVSDRGIGE